MTHDEAIEILNDLEHKGTTQKETYAIGLAIKALSETDGGCGDAISRSDVLSLFQTYWKCFASKEDEIKFKMQIEGLAPVRPKMPEGKWIYQEDHFPVMWKCSKCGMMWGLNTDYCPVCGAKMETEK